MTFLSFYLGDHIADDVIAEIRTLGKKLAYGY